MLYYRSKGGNETVRLPCRLNQGKEQGTQIIPCREKGTAVLKYFEKKGIDRPYCRTDWSFGGITLRKGGCNSALRMCGWQQAWNGKSAGWGSQVMFRLETLTAERARRLSRTVPAEEKEKSGLGAVRLSIWAKYFLRKIKIFLAFLKKNRYN